MLVLVNYHDQHHYDNIYECCECSSELTTNDLSSVETLAVHCCTLLLTCHPVWTFTRSLMGGFRFFLLCSYHTIQIRCFLRKSKAPRVCALPACHNISYYRTLIIVCQFGKIYERERMCYVWFKCIDARLCKYVVQTHSSDHR